MKNNREYIKVTINKKGEKQQQDGHPWVYDNEIVDIDGEYENGDIVDVVSQKGKYLGSGFINNNSKIMIRIISRNANDTFDYDFFKRRLKYAWDYRKNVMGEDVLCCRIIFGEADDFPGLTIDRFNNILVAQVLSLMHYMKYLMKMDKISLEFMKEMMFKLELLKECKNIRDIIN